MAPSTPGRQRRPEILGELKTTLQNVNVPSFVADKNGNLTWLNDAAARTFGDLEGQPFTAIVAPEYVSLVEQQLDRKRRGVKVTDYEIDVFTADGRRRPAEVSSVRIEGGDDGHAIFGVALPGKPRPTCSSSMELTARQTEVLELLGDGASTEQIADALHLSKETVRNHVRHILSALGAHSRLEAVAIAHREGLLRWS
jgi:PAS domain S-box-containing protein